MSTVQSTGGFAADAVRYATDTTGNGSYFLPDSDGLGNNLNVPGNLTVGGTTGLTGALNGSTVNLTGGITTLSNSSFLANILVSQGVYGANSSTPPAFPVGLNSGANVNVTGTVAATVSVTSQDALICGSTASPGGQIKGYNGTAFVAPTFPLGMIGGQNATPYLLAQPTNGTPLQGAAVTWNGSPINIQLNGSASSNAQTFYNIIIPTAFQSIANSGKLLYFGQIVMGGASGALGGVIVNVYNNVVSAGTLISQFGMDPSLTGGAVRMFQGIYEFGNPDYTPFGSISRFSYAGIESQ